MASSPRAGDSGLLRGTRTRSYGSLVQSSYSPVRMRTVEHLVDPGDTLQGLALKYGVTMEQIKRANRLYTNDSIFLKKYLSIPVLTEQPELTNGVSAKDDSEVQGESGEVSVTALPEREGKSEKHRRAGQTELSPSDFMCKLDTRIRVSKRAAVKKIRERETLDPEADARPTLVTGYQSPPAGRSQESSPQTQQRSMLGPVPLTVTTRATALKDRED